MQHHRHMGSGGLLRFHDLPGDGVPVLFIHGLGCASSCDYVRVASHPLLQSHRRLLVDLLGHGFSDAPTTWTYTTSAHAAVIADLIVDLNLTELHLFGHSMGGSIAIETAARLSDRIATLTLSEPNLDPGGGTFSTGIAATPEHDYVATGHASVIDRADNRSWAGAMRASLPQAVHREAVSLVAGTMPTWRHQLYGLTMPRTVIFGAHSLPDPEWNVLARAGIGVAVAENAGHSMACENPEGLAQAIAAAIRR